MLLLVSRFMTWKMAMSFLLTAETWLGAEETREGDEALLAIGVSRHERLGLVQRITGRDPCAEITETPHFLGCIDGWTSPRFT